MAFGGLKGRSQPKQDPPIEKELSLTLEEAFNGCIKKMKIARKVYTPEVWHSVFVRVHSFVTGSALRGLH